MNPADDGADVPHEPETRELNALLDAAHAKGTFDGVALVARGDTVLCRRALGLADREAKTPHALDRAFPIASITKQFTALLVMQEVAGGNLHLDAPVADFLTDFGDGAAMSPQRAQITIKHLLTHQSGLPNPDDVSGFYQNPNRRIGADPVYVVRTFLSGDLLFAPGSQFSYNNGDYFVLAQLLQMVTGMAFPDLLNKRILQPLQMKQTSLVSGPTPRRTPAYEKTGTEYAPEPLVRLQNFGAAGAMQSTAGDMFLWNRALLTNRLLPAPFRDLMWTPDKERGYVACGSWVYGYLPFGKKTPTMVERQGGIGGIFAQNLLVPEDDISITLLSNIGEAAHLAAYTGQGLTCDLLRVLY